MMHYKGYVAKVDFDPDARILHGEVLGIRDVVTFQGDSAAQIEKAFHESVDDYLAFCKQRGEAPDKPYSGQFMVRLAPELHRQISLAAQAQGTSLNALVAQRLSDAVQGHPMPPKITRRHTRRPNAQPARRKAPSPQR